MVVWLRDVVESRLTTMIMRQLNTITRALALPMPSGWAGAGLGVDPYSMGLHGAGCSTVS
jgi:hypothetical protein